MGFLFFKVPSGLCLYFITSSIWSIAERKMLPKPQLDTTNLDTDETNSASKRRTLGSLLGNAAPGSANSNYDNASHLAEKKRRDKERKKRLKQRGS